MDDPLYFTMNITNKELMNLFKKCQEVPQALKDCHFQGPLIEVNRLALMAIIQELLTLKNSSNEN